MKSRNSKKGNKRNVEVVVAMVMAAVAAATLAIDKKAVMLFYHFPPGVIARYLFTGISNTAFLIIFYLGLFLVGKARKKLILASVLSLLLTTTIVALLKISIARERPELANMYSTKYSMPSLHTAIVSAAVPLAPPAFKIVSVIVVVLVSYSRLFFAAHYLSDIFVGFLVGYCSGAIVARLLGKSTNNN